MANVLPVGLMQAAGHGRHGELRRQHGRHGTQLDGHDDGLKEPEGLTMRQRLFGGVCLSVVGALCCSALLLARPPAMLRWPTRRCREIGRP